MNMEEKEEKPFWTKFLTTDYVESTQPKSILPMVMDILEGNATTEQLRKDRDDSHEDDQAEIIQNSRRPHSQ